MYARLNAGHKYNTDEIIEVILHDENIIHKLSKIDINNIRKYLQPNVILPEFLSTIEKKYLL